LHYTDPDLAFWANADQDPDFANADTDPNPSEMLPVLNSYQNKENLLKMKIKSDQHVQANLMFS
jgi:hypothetical protein